MSKINKKVKKREANDRDPLAPSNYECGQRQMLPGRRLFPTFRGRFLKSQKHASAE